MSVQQTTDASEYTRHEVNVAAMRLAKNLRRFAEEANQHLSLSRRHIITAAFLELEALHDGR